MKTILLISPYWKEPHRWMVSSVKLAELWQMMGYHVDIVCMGPSTKGRTNITQNATIEFIKDTFFPDPWNYGVAPGFAGRVVKIVEETKPDFIVVNKILFWSSLSLFSLRLRRHKVFLLTDALVGMTWFPRGLLPRIASVIYAWTIGWLLLICASQIVTYHPQPQGLLKFLGVAKKTRVIPTGIDPGPFSDAEKLREKVEGITATYVGRLESVKGVDDFLATIVPLKKEYPQLKIQVAGWIKPNHPLIPLYQREVSFLGLCDDVAILLAKTHIFVLPSYSEGLSNALMEAMASGCACIATCVGGNRFLIEEGTSGLL